MSVTCFQDQMPWMQNRITGFQGLDIEISKKMIHPYFKGINRTIEVYKTFMIDNCEFVITECHPNKGIVTNQTLIACNSIPNKSNRCFRISD